jgi:nucleotide-binding universal stress UspA family protein
VFENVVAAATDADGAARAVRRATDVARASGGTVHIVATWRCQEPPGANGSREERPWVRSRSRDGRSVDALLGLLRGMASEAKVPVATHEVTTDPADAVARVALQADADLIVIGTRSEGGARRLTAVPRTVLDQASCAVLVV